MNLHNAWQRLVRPLRWQAHRRRNRESIEAGARAGQVFFHDELSALLHCSQDWLLETAAEYREHPLAWEHLSGLRSSSRKTDGEAKSLDVAEGFAAWALVKWLRPPAIVELGVQYGISARLWKEALACYVPGHELILCDLVDRRRFIDSREALFVPGDAFQTLPEIFQRYPVGLLHNDAHPLRLIEASVKMGLQAGVGAFTFHDVGRRRPRGPFRPESATASPEDRRYYGEDYSRFGAWERLVMAEQFDSSILTADAAVNARFKLQVFDSFLGLGAALRRTGRE